MILVVCAQSLVAFVAHAGAGRRLLGLMVSGCGINTIPTYEEQAKATWSEVLNQYQRRADLIPNLVETVKGYATQEQEVLNAVVEARARATQTTLQVPPDILTDPEAFKKFQEAQAQLAGALGRLIAIIENYPDLNRTRISWRCSRSSKAPRTASRWRGATTSRRCGSTTPSSGPSRA